MKCSLTDGLLVGSGNLLAALLFLVVLQPACGGDLALRLEQQNPREFEEWYRPTATWTGLLEFPRPDRRDPAGGVWMLVTQAPHRELIGRRVLVRWDTSRPWDRWFDEHRRDVVFDQKRLAWAMKVGYGPPVILDGWKQVSPLESLPGNRTGELHVLLENPVWRGEALYITSEPVEISGPETALVRFEGPSENSLRLIRHYNPASGNFDGPAEVVRAQEELFGNAKMPMPTSTLAGIESLSLNGKGWYLFGRRQQGVFTVEALEPRAPLQLVPEKIVVGGREARHHLCQAEYQDLEPQTVAMTVVEPNPKRLPDQGPAGLASYIDRVWPVGRRALLIHLFYGWVNEPLKLSRGRMGPWGTGHFSVGTAEVVKDRFTGEKRFDITFWQIYGHNPQQVLSSTQKWHAYCGSLRRGCMFLHPTANTLIQIPELESYAIGDWVIRPMVGLARQFEKMMALYRVGGGTGIAEIWADTSCVQDSCAALFSALKTFERTVAQSRQARGWAAGSGGDVTRYLRLLALVHDVEKALCLFGITPARWREFMAEPLATRSPDVLKRLGFTVTGLKTTLPRNARDHLLQVAVEYGYSMWSIMTVQIGGRIPGLRPWAPKTPSSFTH